MSYGWPQFASFYYLKKDCVVSMKPQTGMHYINIAGFMNQTWNFTRNDIWQKYKFSIISLMWRIS